MLARTVKRIRIGDHEELRHTLAHLWWAIEELRAGNARTARLHLEDVEAAIFTDEEYEEGTEVARHPAPKRKKKKRG